ncbi:hypothetical protein AN191_13070 [Loktanella sp. 5RATIMAR09]|nr:hypothetical protein AN191_13070 [Loktanella sp. 5RATIMAR09]
MVGFHANESLLPGGFVGVDIFFVISGFLICRIIMQDLEAGDFSFWRFYERRARRILPALLVVVIFALCAGLLIYLPDDLKSLGEATVASSLFLSNFYFMNEVQYFADPLENYSLLHLWSLAVEEQFYIVTPIVMILVYRFRANWVVSTLVLLTIASFTAALYLVVTNPSGAFYMLTSRFWEMGIGAVLGICATRDPKGFTAQVASVLGSVLILGSIMLLSKGPPFPGLLAVPCVIGAALYIWAGPESICNRLLSYKLFVWIGLISYSVYLWHWPILSYAKYVTVIDLTLLQTTLAVIASFVAAVLSYRFIEQPFRKKSDFVTTARFLSVLGATLAAISLLGAVLTTGQGLPNRWHPDSLSAMSVAGKVDPAVRFGCRNVFVAALPNGNTCEVGAEKDSYDFIVWGDSHAGAMRAGFAQLALDTDTSGLVIYKNGCSSLLGRRNRNLPFRTNCNEHNLEVLKFLEMQHTRDVILVSRWLTTDNISQFHTGNDVSFWEAVLKLPESGNLAASVQRTVAALEAQDKRVFWLKTVPGQPWHVPSAVAKSLEWSRPVPSQLPRAGYEAVHAPIDKIFDSAGSAIAIPTVDIFCEAMLCNAQRDGAVLYFDDNHVSHYGAILIASVIQQALAENAR